MENDARERRGDELGKGARTPPETCYPPAEHDGHDSSKREGKKRKSKKRSRRWIRNLKHVAKPLTRKKKQKQKKKKDRVSM